MYWVCMSVAGMDFSQTGSLIKDRHLLQRQLSSAGTGQKTALTLADLGLTTYSEVVM